MELLTNKPGSINPVNIKMLSQPSGSALHFKQSLSCDTFTSQKLQKNTKQQSLFSGIKKIIEQKYIFKARTDEKILDLDILYKFKEVYVNSTDNLKIKCWYVPPKPGKPTVLFCHGQNCNITFHQDIVKFLHNNGYGGLLVDYRGYWKNPGEPSEQGLYDDAQAGVRYLNSLGIKNSDIIIWGHSLGGGVATEVAHNGKYKALVMESTFTNIDGMQKHMLEPEVIKQQPLVTRILLNLLKLLPEDLVKFDSKFDNKQKVKFINYPILIVHSKEDEMIPVRMATINHASQPMSKLILFEKGGHAHHNWNIETINDFIKSL